MSESSPARSALADRNLLFGILALQLDFIDRDALIAAMHAWVLDKTKPLGLILREQGQLSAEPLQLLEALVAAHLKAHHDDAQQSLAALPSASSLPQQVRQISDDDLQASLDLVGGAAGKTGEATVDQATDSQGTPLDAGPGSRYRIVRFHAKGGLGEVYVAEDTELHREVALKEIQPAFAQNSPSRTRFLLEAEITGGLEHPGIVPVYGLGTYGDGRPYYAMRFIKGDNLKEAIQDFHQADLPGRDPGERQLALRQLLGRFVDVCQAVAYAHSRGILHRDLKPGNVMLGKYGETLVVDWGLAKPVGRPDSSLLSDEATLRPSAASGTAPTQLGSVVGTPAYMSPEQAAGRWNLLGPASDIYSLGATLYVLLTGQAPFTGDKEAILAKVQRGVLVPPRRVKPGVPAALEAVCLKAMALRPEDRYATALELAADIEHWLADEPVTAYREPWPARVRRWGRRHRPLVASVAVGLVVALLLGGGGWWWLERLRQERLDATTQEVTKALDEAMQWWGQAKGAAAGDLVPWQKAVAAAQRAHGLLATGESTPELGERVDKVAQALVAGEQAARQAAAERERDRRLVARLTEIRSGKEDQFGPNHADAEYAAAFRDAGIDVDNLSVAEAATRIQRHAAVAAELVGALDDWAGERRKRQAPAASWQRLVAVAQQADPDPWRQQVREALSKKDRLALKKLAATTGAMPAAGSVQLLGAALREVGEQELAVQWLRAGQRHHPGDVWLNYDLAEALRAAQPPQLLEALGFYRAARAVRPEIGHNLAHALEEAGQPEETVAIFRELIRLRPTNYRHWTCLGGALYNKGDLDGAIAAYKEALRLNKDVPDIHNNFGAALSKKGALESAIQEYQEALRLKKDFPLALVNLGVALATKGDWAGAIQAYQEALRLKKDDPEAHLGLGAALAAKGDVAGAIQAYQEALRYKKDFPEAYYNLGNVLGKKGDWAGAIQAYQEALRLKKDDPLAHNGLGASLGAKGDVVGAIQAFQAALRLKKDFPEAYYNLGNVLGKKGDLEGAITAYKEALRLKKDYSEAHNNLGVALERKKDVDGAIKEYGEALRLKKEFPEAHNNLGNALAKKGDVAGAIQAYQEALRLKKDNPEAHNNLGNALEAKGDGAGAMQAYQEALRLNKDYPQAHANLGLTLRRLGRFAEARAAFRRAAELDAPSRPESAKQAEQLAQCCEALVALEKRLPALRAGTAHPSDNADRLALAVLCLFKNLPALAARFYAHAFTTEPELADDLKGGHRYYAARMAALAGCGQGEDAATLDAKGRARWRQQARDWLRADLKLLAKQLDQDTPQAKALVQRTLLLWQQHLDLAGVRDEKALITLPQAEQKAWRQFWADVNALLKKAQGKS
jgi:tetratricopeptide (TPR) repeat protein